MPASKQGLCLIASSIVEAQTRVAFYEEAWNEEAIGCEHCIGMGGDGLECRHPDDGEDPFCYSDNCPLIK